MVIMLHYIENINNKMEFLNQMENLRLKSIIAKNFKNHYGCLIVDSNRQ